ncbi:MAG: response regulator [Chloroflexi bacterium]|nr:response regulator [Chloroflexota bacterium]
MIDRMKTPPVVYVVDSSALQRSLIAKTLAAEQLEVSCYETCESMLHSYQEDRPGCLVIDFSLPRSNGLEMARFLRNSGADIPVIFVAERPSVTQAVAAMRFGAVDFLEKPVCDNALLKATRAGVEKDRQLREQRDEHAGLLARIERLTKRERETMSLVLDGLSVKQIASAFGIGLQTAAKHRARLLNKMKVRSDAQLVRLYYASSLTTAM